MMRPLIALLVVGLLAACTPVPFGIERLGALPPDRYAAMERLAATATPVIRTATKVDANTPLPEPFWVYSVDPELSVRHQTLQIGQFTGQSSKAAEVAAELRQRLVEDLGKAHIFSTIGTEPMAGSLVLDGVVVRADTVSNGIESVARSQMELTLSQNGKILGAMQLNSALLNYNSSMIVATALFSLASGSRVSALAGMLDEIFTALAEGKSEGIQTDKLIRRYIFAPPRTEAPS